MHVVGYTNGDAIRFSLNFVSKIQFISILCSLSSHKPGHSIQAGMEDPARADPTSDSTEVNLGGLKEVIVIF